MTYAKLQTLTQALLIGDNKLPKDNEQVLALLDMAYTYLIDKCQVLNLHTEDKSEKIQRLGRGSYVLRKPDLPENNSDELEIDDELSPVVASLIASYISEKKTAIHQSRADEAIRSYNAKVLELIETVNEEGVTP